MINFEIVAAGPEDFEEVSFQVKQLLFELEPESSNEIEMMNLPEITKELLASSKIYAFLAKNHNGIVGVITLHECAAIYAGGIFGEISELYVEPAYRSSEVGGSLLKSAIHKAKESGWTRLEVCSPPPKDWARTVKFYENNGFKDTGVRFRCLVNNKG
jgi:GNAT superfamily N-acetyltransferase